MTWPIALVLLFVTVVAQALLQRSYSQKSKLPESFPPAISYLIGVTPLGIIVGITLKHHIIWSWWLGLLLLTEGIFIGLYNWLSFRAIRRLPLARFQTIFQSYEIVVILLGWTFLREKLNLYQITGGLLIFIAAIVVIRAPTKSTLFASKLLHKHGVIFALTSAFAMGIGLVAEKAALRHMDIGAYFIVGYFTQTLALMALAAKDINGRSIRLFSLYDLKRSLSMGVLSALVGFFYIIAITKSNNISLITALSALGLPLTVLGAHFVLRERDNQKLLWSSLIIAFLGLIVTTL